MEAPAGPILVPLDEAPYARRALTWAIFLAHRLAAPLTLVHVAAPDAREGETAKRTEQKMRRIARRVRSEGIACTVRLVAGDPLRELARLAGTTASRLIALGCRGRPGRDRWILGAVADQVIERSPVPVLLLTKDAHASPASYQGPGPILVALDGSELAELALREAVALARALNRGILLVRAKDPFDNVEGESLTNPYVINAIDEATEGYLWAVAEWVKQQGVPVTTATGWGRPEVFLQETIARERPLVICLSSRGTGGLGRLCLGRVADAVVRDSAVPVLLVGPFAAEGRRSPLAEVALSAACPILTAGAPSPPIASADPDAPTARV